MLPWSLAVGLSGPNTPPHYYQWRASLLSVTPHITATATSERLRIVLIFYLADLPWSPLYCWMQVSCYIAPTHYILTHIRNKKYLFDIQYYHLQKWTWCQVGYISLCMAIGFLLHVVITVKSERYLKKSTKQQVNEHIVWKLTIY